MNRIFVGFIFVLLDVTIAWGNFSIDVIPDFIGYLFLFLGLKEMQHENYWFSRTKSLSFVMVFYSAIIFVSNFIGFVPEIFKKGMAAFFLGYVATGVSLYLAWGLIKGLQSMEETKDYNFFSKRNRASWKMIAILQLISPLCGILGQLATGSVAQVMRQWSILFAVGGVIASLIFLRDFKYARDAYVIYKREEEKRQRETEQTED